MDTPTLIANRIQTPDGTVLWSRHTHDFVSYKDKNGETYILDGGNDYIRTTVNNQPAKSLAVYSDAPYEIIRDFVLRGTWTKDHNHVWVALCNLSNDHLHNLLEYAGVSKSFLAYVLKELDYRQEHNINIEDYDYASAAVLNKYETLE